MRKMLNPTWQTYDPAHMALGDYLAAIGDENGYRMCRTIPLAHDLVKSIQNGEPVAASYLAKIARYLSVQYERTITPDDIVNVNVLTPGQPLPDPTYTPPEAEFAVDSLAGG